MTERVEEIRRQLVRAMTDLGWSQADAEEWDELFGSVVTAALAQAERELEENVGVIQALRRQRDEAERDYLKTRAISAANYDAMQQERDTAQAEVERLKEEMEDSNGAYRDVMEEACAGGITYDTDDRLHCTCVPHLREGVKALEANLARVRAALAGILEIGKRDMSNPKYDGYFDEARAALEGRG